MTMNEEYQPIKCDDYDNLELACTRHWVLNLTLLNGEIVTGAAHKMLSKKRIEYLIIEQAGISQDIRLDHIASFIYPEFGHRGGQRRIIPSPLRWALRLPR
ncbi:Rho-binding antiterminator [Sodalis-like endosymbiont of Proechinophthirus fluctus]|uniref:Rho-binding antiterminator n=1 Tax=Sodalis-like endosymbiont of Proechinophthirus fluctus TaxID=1462730 RepID=UPI000AD2B7B2|nr:Rho-binding antiterminator [Sodalis-like endosymbiont of Proechinophthirus fluctus]